MARPLYEEKVKPFLDVIPTWRKKGMTEKQIAQKLGIGYSTLSAYKIEHKEFLEVLKTSKAQLVSELENSLYKTAMGYLYKEKKILKETDDSGKEKVKTEIVEKQALPNIAAIIFSLKKFNSSIKNCGTGNLLL